ncbi:MAG: hypothetical protein GX764_03605, partial [Firmicutes bacterium]|nr:hypothetical protein [Bacillota bacterium]
AYTDHFPDCGEGFFFLGHLLIIMLFYCEEKSKREELILNSQICLNRANQLLKGKGWQVMQALQDIAAISKEPLETLSGNDKNYMHYRSVDNLIEFCFLKLLT